MAHQLPNEYLDWLGPNWPELCENFCNQSQLVEQLQETHVVDAQDDMSNAASRSMLPMVQAILVNIPTEEIKPQVAFVMICSPC